MSPPPPVPLFHLKLHCTIESLTVDAKDAWKRLERAFQAGSTTAIDLTAPVAARYILGEPSILFSLSFYLPTEPVFSILSL